jgi:hypothetical protein
LNLRLLLVLLILVSLSSIVVTFIVTDQSIERVSGGPPFFYTIPETDIVRLDIDSPTGVMAFELDQENNYWIFAGDETMPVDRQRWNGITTLLGGPRSQRELESSFGDPSLYGLETPDTSVTIGLKDGSFVRLFLGDETPDRSGNYARIEGFPQLVLVSSAWGEVLNRLIADPPIPQWRFDLNVADVTEVVFLVENEVVGALALNIDTDIWHVCNLPLEGDAVCDGDQDIETSVVVDQLNVFADPKFIGVKEVGDTTDDVQAEYGINAESPYATVRFEVEIQQGLRQANQISITLGDLTEDGKGMYALANEQPDVVVVDAEWGQSIREFFNLPSALSAEEPAAPAAAG